MRSLSDDLEFFRIVLSDQGPHDDVLKWRIIDLDCRFRCLEEMASVQDATLYGMIGNSGTELAGFFVNAVMTTGAAS